MIEFLNDIDTQIFLFFNGVHTDFLDGFMRLFTGRLIWWPMYASIIYMMWRGCGWPRMLLYIIGVLVAVILSDQLCADVIRPAIGRLRPSNPNNELSDLTYIVNDYRGGRYGFPSCHAANSLAMAIFVSLMVRRWKFVCFIIGWAVINSYTRLYLGVHYPGDLMAGAVIGSLIGLLSFCIIKWIADRQTPQELISERCTAPTPVCVGPLRFSISPAGIVMCIGTLTVCVISIAALIG